MAGTVVTTEERIGNIYKVKFDWTTGAGVADATTTYYYTGEIVRVVQIPSSGGTTPTALYDVVVSDSDGADVLQGAGANLSETVTTQTWWATTVANTQLTLAVTNAGTSKVGITILYIKVR